MKRIFAIVLAVMMTVTLFTACGGEKQQPQTDPKAEVKKVAKEYSLNLANANQAVLGYVKKDCDLYKQLNEMFNAYYKDLNGNDLPLEEYVACSTANKLKLNGNFDYTNNKELAKKFLEKVHQKINVVINEEEITINDKTATVKVDLSMPDIASINLGEGSYAERMEALKAAIETDDFLDKDVTMVASRAVITLENVDGKWFVVSDVKNEKLAK